MDKRLERRLGEESSEVLDQATCSETLEARGLDGGGRGRKRKEEEGRRVKAVLAVHTKKVTHFGVNGLL